MPRRTASGRRSAVPDKVASTVGYAQSQVVRKRVEEIFGWLKSSAGMAEAVEEVGFANFIDVCCY